MSRALALQTLHRVLTVNEQLEDLPSAQWCSQQKIANLSLSSVANLSEIGGIRNQNDNLGVIPVAECSIWPLSQSSRIITNHNQKPHYLFIIFLFLFYYLFLLFLYLFIIPIYVNHLIYLPSMLQYTRCLWSNIWLTGAWVEQTVLCLSSVFSLFQDEVIKERGGLFCSLILLIWYITKKQAVCKKNGPKTVLSSEYSKCLTALWKAPQREIKLTSKLIDSRVSLQEKSRESVAGKHQQRERSRVWVNNMKHGWVGSVSGMNVCSFQRIDWFSSTDLLCEGDDPPPAATGWRLFKQSTFTSINRLSDTFEEEGHSLLNTNRSPLTVGQCCQPGIQTSG